MAGVPVPKSGFVESLSKWRVIKGKQTWRSVDRDRHYQWDALHGEFEVYDKKGRHLGVADGETGVVTKPAVKGRSIDVS